MKYGNLTLGQMEAIVNKLGGMDGAMKLLHDELSVFPTCPWHHKDGVIYFAVGPTNATTGEGWIARLEDNGFIVGNDAKRVLCSPDFKPTIGVITQIAVLKARAFNSSSIVTGESNRRSKNIRLEAQGRKLTTPSIEVACLIREKFSNKSINSMGLESIVTMHEAVRLPREGYLSANDLHLLEVHCYSNPPTLGAGVGQPDTWWDRDHGFAFAVSQKKPSC